jgi:hypothetical protein
MKGTWAWEGGGPIPKKGVSGGEGGALSMQLFVVGVNQVTQCKPGHTVSDCASPPSLKVCGKRKRHRTSPALTIVLLTHGKVRH